ncbi:MAG: hypothetical protein J6R47_05075 [Acholeplasmatales bacterium]|nr:hypothetical protein [Acholeplasmatales bacterium]
MILEFDMTYSDLKKNPSKARKGMNILDIDSPNLTRFIVVDTINGCPILIQNGDVYKVSVPANMVGDYMLNLRTGYISFMTSAVETSKPLERQRLDFDTLELLRKEVLE